MTGLVRHTVVAEALGYNPSYVAQVAADQGREPHTPECDSDCRNPNHRRFKNSTHEIFPLFKKLGRRWVVSRQRFVSHLEAIGREIPV